MLLPTVLLNSLFYLLLLFRLLLHADRPADPAVKVVVARRFGPPRVPRTLQGAGPEREAPKVAGAPAIGSESRGRRGRLVGLRGVKVGDLREALAAAVLFVGAEDPVCEEFRGVERERETERVFFCQMFSCLSASTKPPRPRETTKGRTKEREPFLTTRCTLDDPCRPGSSLPPWLLAEEASNRPLRYRPLATRLAEGQCGC